MRPAARVDPVDMGTLARALTNLKYSGTMAGMNATKAIDAANIL